jgi:prepilin-type N-terminal cleavage/methylation domain-containing protein
MTSPHRTRLTELGARRAWLQRPRGEDGFTLIELLIVIVVIAILSAIAVPMFLGHGKKGQDAAAKANARNLAGQVQLCHEGSVVPDYTACDTLPELNAGGNGPLSLPYGSGPGQAEVVSATSTTFRVVSHSQSDNDFTLELQVAGTMARDCTTPNNSGCPPNGQW